MGRPAHAPDRSIAGRSRPWRGTASPETDIARVLGIDPKTLRKYYREELDTGHVKANAKVAESLFRKATSDHRQSVTAAIFWLKTRAGWKETSVHEVNAQARTEPMSDAARETAVAEFTRKIEALAKRRRLDHETYLRGSS